MRAIELLRTRDSLVEGEFAELVIWRVPEAVAGSKHRFKYRLAYVVNGVCVVRFDNEAGKGDHKHFGGNEHSYTFAGPDKLLADFQTEVKRWKDENGNSSGP
jgi:Family of unknown function (DUF6516)